MFPDLHTHLRIQDSKGGKKRLTGCGPWDPSNIKKTEFFGGEGRGGEPSNLETPVNTGTRNSFLAR